MIALALAAIALQQQAPALIAAARVDRSEVPAETLIVLTIRVETRGNLPVEIGEPVLQNLERRGFREQSQVSIQAGEATRVTTRQLELMALQPGVATIGPVRVRQGSRIVDTEPITVQVGPAAALGQTVLSSRVRSLLASMPPPEGVENVAVGLVASPSSVMVGGQLDVVVAAWFPRATRLQLRTPPTLTGPALKGAWVYPQPVPSGIAASRQVDGRWYDLYVLHDVVFPFGAGRLEIGRARASYALPVTYAFLTRELRHEVVSDVFAATVTDLPIAGRPRGFGELVASNLRLQIEVVPRSIAVGDASVVSLTLSGAGNVALWPEPLVRWPVEVRVYPGDVEVSSRLESGRVVGSKRFTYLLVPDSAGVHTIGDVSAAYLDLDTRRYAELRAGPVDLLAGEGASVAPERVASALMASAARPLLPPTRFPSWLALALLVFPPAVVFGSRAGRFLASRWVRPPAEVPRTLRDVHGDFRAALERLVPAAGLREGDQLADALRAAGVEQAVAAHAGRIRDRLRHALYGPEGASDPAELAAEAGEVLKALVGEGVLAAPGGGPGWRRLWRGSVLAVAVAAAPSVGWAQTSEFLYAAGAFRVAADSFAARVVGEPAVPAHWYNLGNALYLAGDDAGARAAWLAAARITPRDKVIRRALRLVPPPDRLSARLTAVAPLAPGEAMLAGAVLWLGGWVVVAFRRPLKLAAPVALAGILLGGYGYWTGARYRVPLAIVRRANTPFRGAPYLGAESRRSGGEGTVVRMIRPYGGWLLVGRGSERGWVMATEVAPIVGSLKGEAGGRTAAGATGARPSGPASRS